MTDTIPKYTVRVDGHTYVWSGPSKRIPRPTAKNLEQYVFALARSFEPGGANDHVSQALGYIPYPQRAEVLLNGSNIIVASWEASKFQTYGG